MTEQDVRIQSAEIRVKEASLEAEAAPLRTKISELQRELQAIEERRAGLRLGEAELYLEFTKQAVAPAGKV